MSCLRAWTWSDRTTHPILLSAVPSDSVSAHLAFMRSPAASPQMLYLGFLARPCGKLNARSAREEHGTVHLVRWLRMEAELVGEVSNGVVGKVKCYAGIVVVVVCTIAMVYQLRLSPEGGVGRRKDANIPVLLYTLPFRDIPRSFTISPTYPIF